jgi:uncharacterized protein YndB with AHSA1/START domain
MPRNKDLKRLVRSRMKKTGEAYTTARAHITQKPKRRKSAAPARATDVAPKPDYQKMAGMSDAKVKEKTGCDWQRWVHALDGLKADQMAHGEIATLVSEKFKVDDWWSQMVTVGYERIKGLRARGQRRDGSYEASKSRTFNVPVDELFDAWADAKRRKRWLNADVKVRTATAPKSMRLGWSDGAIIAVGFTAKDKNKSVVALTHPKLADKETAEQLKQFWSEQLDALAELLQDGKV